MDDTDLLLIFGTETGNAEELADDAAHSAKSFDLNPKVMDMEDISPEDISETKRLIVICSTWGEGEQPVNAQDLYDAVEETEEAAGGAGGEATEESEAEAGAAGAAGEEAAE